MKMLLTSNWLPFRKLKKSLVLLSEKKISDSRALIMHTARTRKQKGYVSYLRQILMKYGLKKNNILDVNILNKVHAKKFEDIDLFFSCGGNTFHILERVRKTGFDGWIRRFVKNNGVYIGASAGSILVGPDIKISSDENSIRLKNLDGLKLTKIIIAPHFSEERRERTRLLIQKSKFKVIPIKDGEALLIDGKIVKKVI